MARGGGVKNIYISGRMTGEHCFNFERFFYHAHRFRLDGWNPLNPAEHDCMKMFDGWQYSEDQYEAVIQYDLELIKDKADAIFMLDGWRRSKGARRELYVAMEKGIEIIYETKGS